MCVCVGVCAPLFLDRIYHARQHIMCELERMTVYYVGVIIALSIIHEGLAPQLVSPAVADYIVLSVQTVNATIGDVPHHTMTESLQKV